MKTLFTIAAITATLLAQASGNFSMIEINPDHGTEAFIWSDSAKNVYGAGEMSNFTELNGKLYFIARNTFDNDELWSTDGKESGTSLVKDINLNGSAMIGNLVKVGNRLLFMAADNNNWDFDIWSTDGTEIGTVKVADINQSCNTTLAPQNVATFGNRMIFCSPTQLMITDGTAAGTDSLMAIIPYSQGFGYCELNNKVYFILNNNLGQNEIWRTDGTTMGTQQVINIETAPSNITSVTQMAAFNGKIYMVAATTGQGNDLFVFDGNINGQLQKIELAIGGNSYPGTLTLFNGALYFTASTMTSANVFRITSSNSVPQALIPNASFSWLSGITYANNGVYFLGEDQMNLHRIDLSSLAYSSTRLNGYYMPSYLWTESGMLVGHASKVYFAAYDSVTNNQVLLSGDESLQNIASIMPVDVGITHPFNALLSCGMADVFDFYVWNNKIMIPANFNEAGRELWILEAGAVSAIDDMKNQGSFTLFPNPTNGEITIQSSNSGYCDREFRVVNLSGEVILEKKMSDAKSTIKLHELAAGNYFVILAENGKTIATKKFVIAK